MPLGCFLFSALNILQWMFLDSRSVLVHGGSWGDPSWGCLSEVGTVSSGRHWGQQCFSLPAWDQQFSAAAGETGLCCLLWDPHLPSVRYGRALLPVWTHIRVFLQLFSFYELTFIIYSPVFFFFFPASFPSVFMRQVMRVSVLSCHLWWKHFSVLPLSLTLFTVFFLVLEDFMFSGAHHIDIWTVSASVDMLRNISSNSKFI